MPQFLHPNLSMNFKPTFISHGVASLTSRPPMLTISEDGYIRLTLRELQEFRLIHLTSGLDNAETPSLAGGASQSEITGYTEWLSESTPAITMGWDWEMDFIESRVQVRRVSEPRSNLMLQDINRKDISHEKSLLLQELYLDGFDWQSTVLEYINTRYR